MLTKITGMHNQLQPTIDNAKKDISGEFQRVMSALGAATSKVDVQNSDSLSYEALAATYENWSQQRRIDGAGNDYMDSVDAMKQTYLGVLKKAVNSGGFDDPVSFLSELTTGELKAIQITQSIGSPIDPSALTSEGAYNLLVPRPLARDINGDGDFMVGASHTFIFPPGDAPQSVKDAWAKVTENMSFELKLHLSMSLHLARQANTSSGIEWSKDSIYKDLVGRAIEGANFNLRVAPNDQKAFVARELAGLQLLQKSLDGAI